nr:hypothetical protein [bacterium]
MSSETLSNSDANKSIAWIVSVGIHVGIGLLAFFITWSVVRVEEVPPHIVSASWHEQPVTELAKLPLQAIPSVDQEQNLPTLTPPEPKESIQDGFAVLHTVSSSGVIPELARREPEQEVQFMGLDAVAAKRIVYVVDASGSMLLHLSTVLEELERSLRTLHPKQEFGILFF